MFKSVDCQVHQDVHSASIDSGKGPDIFQLMQKLC